MISSIFLKGTKRESRINGKGIRSNEQAGNSDQLQLVPWDRNAGQVSVNVIHCQTQSLHLQTKLFRHWTKSNCWVWKEYIHTFIHPVYKNGTHKSGDVCLDFFQKSFWWSVVHLEQEKEWACCFNANTPPLNEDCSIWFQCTRALNGEGKEEGAMSLVLGLHNPNPFRRCGWNIWILNLILTTGFLVSLRFPESRVFSWSVWNRNMCPFD